MELKGRRCPKEGVQATARQCYDVLVRWSRGLGCAPCICFLGGRAHPTGIPEAQVKKKKKKKACLPASQVSVASSLLAQPAYLPRVQIGLC